jgi:acetolactate synthase-1/2/3 large subunit
MKEAFYIARTGRQGPVLVDIPKDVQIEKMEFFYPDEVHLPGYRPAAKADENDVASAASMIQQAQQPIILAGHGIMLSGAMQELRELAELAGIPVALTLLGKGAMPESHPLVIGMMGMHGVAAANHAIQNADLLIALGMRFDDRVTGNLKTYAKNARKIHIDIDPSEINKNVAVDIGVAGDLKTVLRQIIPKVEQTNHPQWIAQIRDWQEDSSERDIINTHNGGLIAAQVINDLWKFTGGDSVTVTDVGQHQMIEAQYYPHQRPATMLTSGGLGTMGFGFPAAIGAKFGRPEEEVWAIVGDGGFQMTMAELATAVQEKVDINIAIVNNGFLGMVRQWQEIFYEKRYQSTPMFNPDFCKLADAYGIPNMRVTERSQMPAAVEFARSIKGPVLIEFVVEKEEMVYPMVPAGADLDNMIRRPKPEQKG